MNNHLNVFHFFNESSEKQTIENNLSRAFSICLINNSLFLNEFLKSILTTGDFNYLFSLLSVDSKYSLDIQVDTSAIEKDGYSKVYAVAMTSLPNFEIHDFFIQPDFGERTNNTDIMISVKDIAIIIEVKKNDEDCKAQLYNQVLPFIKEGCIVIPMGISWQKAVGIMQQVKHLQHLVSAKCVFITDFLLLSEVKFPHWFEPKPFNVIPFSSHPDNRNYIELSKRMRQALSSSAYELLSYSDRLGISVPFGWAQEIVCDFKSLDDNIGNYVVLYIWPGNTKQQGYKIFTKSLDWQAKRNLILKGDNYKMTIDLSIKLCHFNRYISGINFSDSDVFHPIHTVDNFYEKSGKWDRNSWKEFEGFMDSYFKPEFNWRNECKWDEKFINTDRNYFTMSLGYEVMTYVPFSKFMEMDKNEKDVLEVSHFINEVANEYSRLIQ